MMPQEEHFPLVTAIITTLHRPELVARAIASVFGQTYSNLELIVVIDGPDTPTEECLAKISDPRMRVLLLPHNVGIGEARNAGTRESTADWVAFLDDDDEWLPEKISTQLGAALDSFEPVNLVVSRYEERTFYGSRLRPEAFPAPEALWSESFYCDKVLLLPSTFLVKRSLMLAHPFRLRRHEDADWLLRGHANQIFHVLWVKTSLTVYHCEALRSRLSTEIAWKSHYDWWINNPALLTRRAVPFYIAMICIPEAKRSPSPVRTCIFLLSEAISKGTLSLHAIAYLAMVTLTSADWRSKHRHRLSQSEVTKDAGRTKTVS